MNRKFEAQRADNVTKQHLKYEAEALYSKCQQLESQLERVVTENAYIREAQQKELSDGNFNVASYLKWRNTFKSPDYKFDKDESACDDTSNKLLIHRENMKLKDELTEIRVEFFTLKQQLECKEQVILDLQDKIKTLQNDLKTNSQQLLDSNEEIKRLADVPQRLKSDLNILQTNYELKERELLILKDPINVISTEERVMHPLKMRIYDLENELSNMRRIQTHRI